MADRSFSILDCSVTDDRFVQFIEALKVNATLTEIRLGGTFKLFHVFRYY